MMKLLTTDMKMAEVIHYNYHLISVINRFGIKLGFGHKTIQAICDENNIDSAFFLTIINTFSNKNYLPERKELNFNILEFIAYLRKTHKYYLSVQVPLIEKYLDAVVESCSNNSSNLVLLKKFFQDYKSELIEHLTREELKTFPYIERLYKLTHEMYDYKIYQDLTKDYSMNRYMEEHDDIDEKLIDLQNIIIKYLTGDFNEEFTHILLFELFRFEKDIKNHSHLEELILKPMVEEMEKSLHLHIYPS